MVGKLVLCGDGFRGGEAGAVDRNRLSDVEIAQGDDDIVFGVNAEGLDGGGHSKESMDPKPRVDKWLRVR